MRQGRIQRADAFGAEMVNPRGITGQVFAAPCSVTGQGSLKNDAHVMLSVKTTGKPAGQSYARLTHQPHRPRWSTVFVARHGAPSGPQSATTATPHTDAAHTSSAQRCNL